MPETTTPSSPTWRMCSVSSTPLSSELAVIARRSGSWETTALKFPLVPSTQPRAWKRRLTATSASAIVGRVSDTLGDRRCVLPDEGLDLRWHRAVHLRGVVDELPREPCGMFRPVGRGIVIGGSQDRADE